MTTFGHCRDCRFWNREKVFQPSGLADCLLISDHPEERTTAVGPLATVWPWAGADGGSLGTSAEFGCVHFEQVSS